MSPKHTLSPRRTAALAAQIERRLAIERLRDAVIDLDLAVDDARDNLEAAIRRVRAAVHERDELARRLLETIDAEKAA